MNNNLSRRNFLQAAAATGAVAALVGCTSSDDTEGSTASAAASSGLPSESDYPIDPEEWGSGTVRYATEELREGWTRVTNEDDGAELGIMDADKLIQVDGYAFKDLNGNGKLDFYEDWRQDASARAASLASQLTADECMFLKFHGDFSMTDSLSDEQRENLEQGQRAGVVRSAGTADTYATAINWTNELQQVCEEEGGYGIPYWNSVDPYSLHDLPDTNTLAATFDMDLARKTANYLSRGWRAVGITCDLGPQIDIASNPVYSRFSGTFTEDPALDRDFTRAFVDGLQSTYGDDDCTDDQGWGKQSCAGMMKHYPGDGACEGGRNSHNETGKYAVYANDNLGASLVAFTDGALHLDGKTEEIAAVMPYYAIPYTEDEHYGENVAAAYNGYVLGILRNAGWDGVICTDWQISQETYFDGAFNGRHFGVDDLTPVERIAKGYLAGTDEFGGEFQPDQCSDVLALLQDELGEDGALEEVQASARRLFVTEMNLGLFENPYIDRDTAKEYFEDTTIDDFAADLLPKCVIMLKNASGTICERSEKPTVYVPMVYTAGTTDWMTGETSAGSWGLAADQETLEQYFTVVTDTMGDPTGEADEDGNATYTENDVVRATSDELATCDFALVFASGPNLGDGSTTDEDGNVTYTPMSLQYGAYTADGANVRQVSLAGDTLEDGSIENRSYYGQTNAGDTTELEKILSVVETAGDVPVVVAMASGNPMIFSEFEDQVDTILFTPGSNNTTAICKIVSGEVEPSGLLPFQMPKDMDTVEANAEDTPRDCEPYMDSVGNEYDFAFGMNWSGVIDDERVSTYNVDPLDKPETVEY